MGDPALPSRYIADWTDEKIAESGTASRHRGFTIWICRACSVGCGGLLAPNGCCFCPNTFTHIQYIQVHSTLFDTILRRKWHIQSETHSHFSRILRHATRASRAIWSRSHSGRTFMAFGRDTFRENLHLITFNPIPVACIHAHSCWSHSCIF